jgi:hypothetical protein
MVDPIVQAMIAMLGGADPSSATMDPVLGLLTNTYRPDPTYSEEELYMLNAPTILQAGAEGAGSPRAIAASRVRSGEPVWSIAQDEALRGNISEKDWNKFINQLAKEQESVRVAQLKQELKPDQFAAKNLPSVDERWNVASLMGIAPQAFSGALQGASEAFGESERLQNQLAKLSQGKQIYGKDILKALEDEVRKEFASKKEIDKSSKEVDELLKKRTEWVPSPTQVIGRGLGQIGRGIGRAWKGGIEALWSDEPAIRKEAENRLRQLAASTPAGEKLSYTVAASPAELRALEQKISKRKYVPGTAESKAAQAEQIASQLGSQLEAAGITPLMDALLRSAALRKRMKNG